MQHFSHLCEYLFLRFLQVVLTIIPRRIALSIGSLCGGVMYHLGIYRRIVSKNMEHVGLWDGPSMDRITRSLYRNIGRYAVDFLRPARPLPPHEIHDFEKIEPPLGRGKGTVVILGHLGNWEMLSTVFGKRTGRLHVVAQMMSNTIIDKWLLAKRTASSVTTIYSGRALRKMIDVIRNDGIIAILIDQFTKKHGTPAPFLGKEANTVRTAAGLVRKTGCSVITTHAIIRPDNGYDVTVADIPEPDLAGLSEEEAINAVQKQHNDTISNQILAYPDHWFGWFHRRFRGYVDYTR